MHETRCFSGASPWHTPDPLTDVEKYPFDRDTVMIFDTATAETMGAEFYRSDGNAILSRHIIPPEALVEIRYRESGQILLSKRNYEDLRTIAMAAKLEGKPPDFNALPTTMETLQKPQPQQ